MLKTRKPALVAIAVAAALLVSGCSGSQPADEGGADGASDALDKVNVASIDVEGTIPLLLGADEGIFEKHGIDIETTMAPAFDGTLAAVMNGQADIGFAASPPMIRAMVKGAPIQAVAQTAVISGDEAQASVVTNDPAIVEPLDLIGKSVAVASLNDLASIGIRVAVAQAGGNPEDVQFVELPGPQRLPALLDGKIDAAIFIGAPALGALKKDGIHLVFQYTEALPEGSPLDMYFSKTDFIAGNADLLKRFRAAMTEASEFANANPDKVRDYVRQLLADVPDELEVVDDLQLTTYRTDIDPDALMALQDVLVQYGGLEKTIPADEFFSFENGK